MTPGAAVVWRHARSLAVVESPDRVALVDLARLAEPPRVLEGSAAVIWQAVDGERTPAEVVRSVAASFEAEPGDIEVDVVAFLESLADAGLIEAR